MEPTKINNFVYMGYDGKSLGVVYTNSTFCSCCGSSVISSKTGKQNIRSADWGIKLIVDNVTKPGIYTRTIKRQDNWQRSNNIPAQKVVKVSQVETRNGPLTIAIRVV